MALGNNGWLLLGMMLSAVGCWSPDAPRGSAGAPLVAKFISVWPARSAQGVSPLSRFTFSLPAGTALTSLKLYRDTLSDYDEHRVVSDNIPGTLADREVKVVAWESTPLSADAGAATSDHRIDAMATAALQSGTVYTWALLTQGVLLSFQVGPPAEPWLERYWPATGAGFFGYAAYCSERPLGNIESQVQFAPDFPVKVAPGLGLGLLGNGSCVSLEVDPGSAPDQLIPPPQIAGMLVDPAPLERRNAERSSLVDCQAGWQQLGPGCSQVQDDRLLIQPPNGASLWLLSSDAIGLNHVAPDGSEFALRGLSPSQPQVLAFKVLLEGGARFDGTASFTTLPARDHLVINEVLANPLGAEPAQEWIELYNDGTQSLDLANFQLADEVGKVDLPTQVVAAGEYAVLTSDRYQTGGPDVEFAAGAHWVPMPSLSAGGLSNAGEALQLISISGTVLSRFPAIAAKTGGVSIARRIPDAPDDQPQSFAQHAAPGASPGAVNAVDAETP
ncbi:MAG TPA: lamin tail domain-containing protein [Polyangiaceae bacterium]|nr:lamin tail domain-containing protein [Polyangiaceae bacterium]